ncbi:acetyl/propionyl/methylcrotonyl-CoA carboxylase subunit alpha [Nocardia aurantiaca]|uniref:Acetyl/propionyl-CoA carboxylase subunit alpha n=1 Tax=Nocardia aurantiaca TaxID=2675850 RepID=A0A6I3L7Q4_9NOCA|nr:biotin carboxylase N-terminal domain-containing protein [Nocardia aurantiaca]MTE16754.1 acetyl/propionyl-CoA carboxylase subunit alpha [Nocardia aurantiaca]
MIRRLLVANRGEIACRIFRTCRDLGISTVAVFSDADAAAAHVEQADTAVWLPGNTPAETYLRADLLIEAARRTDADAIHPGYGFLSENAEFAQAVIDAGLTWVGPPPAAIETMGSKIRSKKLMDDAGVPVLTELEPAAVTDDQLPVLVKASAGGGGRGMRVARSLAELPDTVAAASSEAASAFGDPTVFCEPYLERGRHIEVQILADEHGTTWALGERECSIQRRHQKIIEETPSPMVDPEMRERLCGAAVAAAEAVGYVGAGTVEFLATEAGRFYFLEMNTRLQVEHPVTECVTGLDLVAWQLRIALGEPLPQDGPPPFDGHSIEARLYAEDPAHDWQPTAGHLHRFEFPSPAACFDRPQRYGLRVDAGYRSGDTVSTHYDAMLAKVITWAPNRGEAIARLAGALGEAHLHGVTTNRDLLVRLLHHEEFRAGDFDTSFFGRHGLETLASPLATPEVQRLCAAAAALSDAAVNRTKVADLAGLPSAWRNVPAVPQRKEYAVGATTIAIEYQWTRGGIQLEGFDRLRVVDFGPALVTLEVDGLRTTFTVATYPDRVCVDCSAGAVTLERINRFPDPAEQHAAGTLLAPMPGTVTALHAADGDAVSNGDPLITLEAMKMHHTISASDDGIAEIKVVVGQQVDAGAILAIVAERTDES